MKEIVFFDLDGTLLDNDKNVPAAAREAVHKLQKNGIYTAIATGRAPFMVEHLLDDLNISSYICFNGQYIVFEGEVLFENPINNHSLLKLTDLASTHGHSVAFMNDTTIKANAKNDKRIKKTLATLKLPHPEYDPLFFEKQNIFQALLFAERDEVDYTESMEGVSFIRWHDYALDVVPKGGSKAEGIKRVISELNIEMDNVFAFGDGMNDIEMLQTVGTGIAMGNAHDVVKENADLITTDADQDGIVNGLKEVGLLPKSFETLR